MTIRPVLAKIKPASGFAKFLHLGLLVLLPLLVLILVQLKEFVWLPLSLIVLSKWRMFAVRPRFWAANVRANAVDLMVGLSIVLFMTHAPSFWVQLLWAILYGVWLIVIKPASGLFATSTQAFIGQFCALMVLYLVGANAPLWILTTMTGLICFLAARHFFDAFNESYAKLLSYIWAYFGAALAWLLGHWLLYYKFISQPALLLTTLGYGIAALYYLDHRNRLSKGTRRQFIFVMLAIVLVVIAFSDWGNKIV